MFVSNIQWLEPDQKETQLVLPVQSWDLNYGTHQLLRRCIACHPPAIPFVIIQNYGSQMGKIKLKMTQWCISLGSIMFDHQGALPVCSSCVITSLARHMDLAYDLRCFSLFSRTFAKILKKKPKWKFKFLHLATWKPSSTRFNHPPIRQQQIVPWPHQCICRRIDLAPKQFQPTSSRLNIQKLWQKLKNMTKS